MTIVKVLRALILLLPTLLFGQAKPVTAGSVIMQPKEIDKVFTPEVKQKFNITFHIFRAYKCADKSGESYIVLTEHNDVITPDKDTLSYKIRGFNFLNTPAGLVKQWEINDFIVDQGRDRGMETGIWFWTKFSTFQDVDKNGLIDPVIIYGTYGSNDYDDGRIKILIFYKGQKIAIRHQNAVLDFDRNTQVDEAFYSLPLALQNHVKVQMQKLMSAGYAIFPAGWETAMQKHKLKFDEKH